MVRLMNVQIVRYKTMPICIKCGSNKAICGSLKHPYCAKCFKEEWNEDYKRYFDFLNSGEHYMEHILRLPARKG